MGHGSQENERSVASDRLEHRHETFPHFNSRAFVDQLHFLPDLLRYRVVSCLESLAHLLLQRSGNVSDCLHPCGVFCCIDVGFE